MHYYMLRSAYKVITVVVFFTILSALMLSNFRKEQMIKFKTLSSRSPAWLTRDLENCRPAKNIAFLKVHKASSSAIQRTLIRFGLKHNLTFALPDGRYTFNLDVPFNIDMIHPQKLIGKIDFNIFAYHCKWNYEQIKKLMPKDTIFIASVRKPIEQFLSMYRYAGMPLKSFDENVVEKNPEPRLAQLFNFMISDFGLLRKDMDDEEAVKNLIDTADKHFDLVMVTERIEESWVLLRQLLCWSYEDFVTFKVNALKDKFKIKKMKPSTEKALRSRLKPDTELYNHFRRKFDQLVKEFGEERMEYEKKMLEKSTAKTQKDCGLESESYPELEEVQIPAVPRVYGFKVSNTSYVCQLLTYVGRTLVRTLRERQSELVKNLGLT